MIQAFQQTFGQVIFALNTEHNHTCDPLQVKKENAAISWIAVALASEMVAMICEYLCYQGSVELVFQICYQLIQVPRIFVLVELPGGWHCACHQQSMGLVVKMKSFAQIKLMASTHFAYMLLQAFYPVIAQHKPQLKRPESFAQGNLPVLFVFEWNWVIWSRNSNVA